MATSVVRKDEILVSLEKWIWDYFPKRGSKTASDGYKDLMQQVSFVTSLFRLMKKDLSSVFVIGEYKSGNTILPVYQIIRRRMIITMRNNFHNWKVSVDASTPLSCDFSALLDPEEEIHYIFCDGFPEHLVYGSYAKDQKRFTVNLVGHENLHRFFKILLFPDCK